MNNKYLEKLIDNSDKMGGLIPIEYINIMKYLKNNEEIIKDSDILDKINELTTNFELKDHWDAIDSKKWLEFIFDDANLSQNAGYYIVPVDNLINKTIKSYVKEMIDKDPQISSKEDKLLYSILLMQKIIKTIALNNKYMIDSELYVPAKENILSEKAHCDNNHLRLTPIANSNNYPTSYINSIYHDSLDIVRIIESYIQENPDIKEINIAIFGEFIDEYAGQYHIDNLEFKNKNNENVRIHINKFYQKTYPNGKKLLNEGRLEYSLEGNFYNKKFIDQLLYKYDISICLNPGYLIEHEFIHDDDLKKLLNSINSKTNIKDKKEFLGLIKNRVDFIRVLLNGGYKENYIFALNSEREINSSNHHMYKTYGKSFQHIYKNPSVQGLYPRAIQKSNNSIDLDLFTIMNENGGTLLFTKGYVAHKKDEEEWNMELDYVFIELIRKTKIRVDYHKFLSDKTIDFQFVFDKSLNPSLLANYFHLLQSYWESLFNIETKYFNEDIFENSIFNIMRIIPSNEDNKQKSNIKVNFNERYIVEDFTISNNQKSSSLFGKALNSIYDLLAKCIILEKNESSENLKEIIASKLNEIYGYDRFNPEQIDKIIYDIKDFYNNSLSKDSKKLKK